MTIGGCRGAVLEAVEELAAEGIALDYLRIRGFPFAESVESFLMEHELVFVVEQNRDAQLRSLLVLETEAEKDRLLSVRYYGGLPMSCHHVVEGVTARLEEVDRAPEREGEETERQSAEPEEERIIPARRRASP